MAAQPGKVTDLMTKALIAIPGHLPDMLGLRQVELVNDKVPGFPSKSVYSISTGKEGDEAGASTAP